MTDLGHKLRFQGFQGFQGFQVSRVSGFRFQGFQVSRGFRFQGVSGFKVKVKVKVKVMINIKEYLSRIGKSKGFGIQSPWAFRFVTEVVRERWRYYGYDDIEARYSGRYERKYQKLLFRIRNFIYPHTLCVIDIEDGGEALADAVSCATEQGAIVIEGIRRSKSCQERWEEIKQREDVGVTFDMYSFAVCFLDRKIYKQHYKLNFL